MIRLGFRNPRKKETKEAPVRTDPNPRSRATRDLSWFCAVVYLGKTAGRAGARQAERVQSRSCCAPQESDHSPYGSPFQVFGLFFWLILKSDVFRTFSFEKSEIGHSWLEIRQGFRVQSCNPCVFWYPYFYFESNTILTVVQSKISVFLDLFGTFFRIWTLIFFPLKLDKNSGSSTQVRHHTQIDMLHVVSILLNIWWSAPRYATIPILIWQHDVCVLLTYDDNTSVLPPTLVWSLPIACVWSRSLPLF